MPLVSGTGSTRWIVCPYHLWSYGRDGALHTAPLMDDAADFDIEQCRLPQLAVEEWQGFVFVSMDADAAPLAPRLEPLAERLAPYGLARLVIADTIEFDSPWNWKLLVENFMEAYHHIGAHRDTFQVSNPAKDSFVVDNEGGPWSLLSMPGAAGPDEPHADGSSVSRCCQGWIPIGAPISSPPACTRHCCSPSPARSPRGTRSSHTRTTA